MHVVKGTYYKALLLLVVFSLNTLVSFACSLGGVFHSLHHSSSVSSSHKQHKHHHGGDEKPQPHEHKDNHHSKSDAHKDDCCSNSVLQIEKIEKSVSRSIEAPNAVFLTSFLTYFTSLFSLFPAEEKTFFPYYIRWRLTSTIQDLRIVIQSFQI